MGDKGLFGTHIADEFIRNGKIVVIYDPLCLGLESRMAYLHAKLDFGRTKEATQESYWKR